MAKLVLTNTRLFVDGADLTSNNSKVELKFEAEDVDVTSFASNGWKETMQGIASTSVTAEGQWEAGDPGKVDDALWSTMSVGNLVPWTICPNGAADGALAYFTQMSSTKYAVGGEVGSVLPWSAEAAGSWPVSRGVVAHPPGTARTTSGTGTGVQLGAVALGQSLYASLHVLSVSGTGSPSITVAIESDADNTFATPTTQLTFTAATAVGGQIMRTAGPITDTWYRAKWTITGTTPSFLFLSAFDVR